MIEQKISELGRFLTGKSTMLDFVEPTPTLERQDDREMRAKVLALTVSQAKQLGIGKSTFHYLHTRAGNPRPFKMYHSVHTRLH